MSQNTSHAVMAQRTEPRDAADDFPTPPWSTRALVRHVLQPRFLWSPMATVWEPACGRGIMSEVLKEFFGYVYATDLYDYGAPYQDRLCDFTRPADYPPHIVSGKREPFGWVITNPPFTRAAEFADAGLALAATGVALLVRSTWLEGKDRYERIFSKTPPAIVAQFVERVPMVKGRWDPDASTATSYAWVVWTKGHVGDPAFVWIPPGQRKGLTKPDDVARFAPHALEAAA